MDYTRSILYQNQTQIHNVGECGACFWQVPQRIEERVGIVLIRRVPFLDMR
jgi:hypothetical protein